MGADFPYLYRNSRAEAIRLGEIQRYDDSFHCNVSCARSIEQAIRDHFNEADESLGNSCAQSVLEQYGFKRVNFVLANSLKEFQKSVCNHLVHDETYQWGQKTFVPPDGKYNRYFAVDTAAALLEAFIGQAREAYQALGLFGPEHCVNGGDSLDYTGRVLVMSPDTLREECWDALNMLWVAEGGFGCSPTASGRAVYATCLGDGEQTRWNRTDFTGVLKDELLDEIAAARFCFDELTENATAYPELFLEYLLEYDDPLEVIREQWMNEQCVDLSDELEHAMWSLWDHGPRSDVVPDMGGIS